MCLRWARPPLKPACGRLSPLSWTISATQVPSRLAHFPFGTIASSQHARRRFLFVFLPRMLVYQRPIY
jgi:hypothetical protein